jgi:hypothetical protein
MEIETKLAGLTADQLRKCALYIQAASTIPTAAAKRAALDRLANRLWAVAMERSVATALNQCWPAPSETAGYGREICAPAMVSVAGLPNGVNIVSLVAELEARRLSDK